MFKNILVNNNKLIFQLNLGAVISLLTYEMYKKLLKSFILLNSDFVLRSFTVDVQFNNTISKNFIFHIDNTDHPDKNLLDRDFLKNLSFKITSDLLLLQNSIVVYD